MRTKGNILKDPEFVECDVMVIGGGGAGLRAAIAAMSNDNKKVFIVSKSRIGHACNTYISKAIVAASGQTDSGDNAHAHLIDTLEGGRFLNDPAIVSQMTRRIPSEVSFLESCGVNFLIEDKKLQVFKVPGHKYPRNIIGANWKGSDLVLPLKHQAQKKGVRFFERVFVTRLFESDGRISGATGLTPDGSFLVFQAKSIVLATGGYAQIFLNTNNAAGITGDGHAIAYTLGVPLKDMEFVQFYPTALGRRGNRLFFIEKLLAQEGVTLENSDGQDISRRSGYPDPLAMSREKLAQLVMQEIKESAGPDSSYAVLNLEGLSADAADSLTQLLPPSWWQGQKKFNVVPTAHYSMGGIVTDDCCQTAVKGLFAVGEVAAGCHGAGRIGGNSLAEILAMGSLAGESASRHSSQRTTPAKSIQQRSADEKRRLESAFSEKGKAPKQLIHAMKKIMWHKAGIIRTQKDLKAALDTLRAPWPDPSVTTFPGLIHFLEFVNLRVVSEMVCRAALRRKESRGSHFRQDFPDENDARWRTNIEVYKGPAGMELDINSPKSSITLRQ